MGNFQGNGSWTKQIGISSGGAEHRRKQSRSCERYHFEEGKRADEFCLSHRADPSKAGVENGYQRFHPEPKHHQEGEQGEQLTRKPAESESFATVSRRR